MSRRIDYYFSFQSPWSHIGHADFVRVAKHHAALINYRPVPLGRLFAETGGEPLAKRHPFRQAYRMIELQRWRDQKNMKLQLRPKFWPFNPSLADRTVAVLADTAIDPELFVPQAFAAVFADERNLADEAVVSAILTNAGLAAADLIDAAKSDQGQAAYDANLAAAMDCGVFGAPSYVLDGEIFWGQDRVSFLDEALASGRPPYRAQV